MKGDIPGPANSTCRQKSNNCLDNYLLRPNTKSKHLEERWYDLALPKTASEASAEQQKKANTCSQSLASNMLYSSSLLSLSENILRIIPQPSEAPGVGPFFYKKALLMKRDRLTKGPCQEHSKDEHNILANKKFFQKGSHPTFAMSGANDPIDPDIFFLYSFGHFFNQHQE